MFHRLNARDLHRTEKWWLTAFVLLDYGVLFHVAYRSELTAVTILKLLLYMVDFAGGGKELTGMILLAV